MYAIVSLRLWGLRLFKIAAFIMGTCNNMICRIMVVNVIGLNLHTSSVGGEITIDPRPMVVH